MAKKAPDAFRTISEVSDWLGVQPPCPAILGEQIRQVKPVKRAGGRRYYRPADMELLGGIRKLLHDDGLTVKGVQKVLREQGVKSVAAMSPAVSEGAVAPPANAIFSAPAPNVGRPNVETTGQKTPDALPLFSEAPSPVEGASVSDPGIPEPSKGGQAQDPPQAPGLVIAPLPDLPSEAPSTDAAPVAEAPPTEAPPRPVKPVVIAPLPEEDLPLAARLARLQPGQISVDALAPLHGRLTALRARMAER